MTFTVEPEWRCDASISVETDHVGKPIVRLCRKPAKIYGMAALCDEHKDVLDKYRKVKK